MFKNEIVRSLSGHPPTGQDRTTDKGIVSMFGFWVYMSVAVGY